MNAPLNSSSSPTPSTSTGWRLARSVLLGVAALATLIVLFYTVENWRGKRAWQHCRQALEAKGEVLDWATYIPALVPDEQNFYKAPRMQEWFSRDHFAITNAEPPNAPKPFVPAPHQESSLLLAEVTVVAPNAPVDAQHADAVLRFDEPSAREHARQLLHGAVGPGAIGAQADVLLARPLAQHQPLHLVLQADTVPTVADLTAFFPRSPMTNFVPASANVSYLRIDATGDHAFRLSLKAPVYGAADYLAWTEPLTPNFDQVRKALERPSARIDCDYTQPFAIAVPNFIALRRATQVLSQRAQCYLLLGQPEAAWHELALVHDLCQILGTKPPGTPVTLVGAMMNCAIMGMYATTVKDGLRLHAWREPQLLAMERQLQESDLLAMTVKAFKEERVATCHSIETMPRRGLVKLMSVNPSNSKWGWVCIPQGWLYQNMVVGSGLEQEWLEGSIDLTHRVVQARHINEVVQRASAGFRSPYSCLVAVALPNFGKALQATAQNQTLLNEAGLACALERCRLAQGQYPNTLAALTPQFVAKLPHDLMGGEPLKYHRTESGYQLYSIGWNEKDDGGIPGKSRDEGDWVWSLD